MTAPAELDDVTLVRIFNEARRTLDLPTSLRAVAAEINDLRSPIAVLVANEVARQMGIPEAGALFRRPLRERTGNYHCESPLFEARRVAWWVSHVEFSVTQTLLAEMYGGRAPSTVVKVLNKFQARLVDDPVLQDLVASVTAAVRQRTAGRVAA